MSFLWWKIQSGKFYIQHQQSVHGNLPPEYLDKELFVCDQCPQVFITKISLSMHVYNGHNAENKLKKKRGKEKSVLWKEVSKLWQLLGACKIKTWKKRLRSIVMNVIEAMQQLAK